MSDVITPPSDPDRISVKEFFEDVHPGKPVLIRNLAARDHQYAHFLQTPAVQLHCETASCQGIRFFEPTERKQSSPEKDANHFLRFVCRNCKTYSKTYAFWSYVDKDKVNGQLMKFGEDPPFGPPTPARVITLIGSERDYYLKGRRSENQGLGIAAFAYYRRVVENRKTHIITEIIRVAQKVGASQEVLDELVKAQAETQFSRAVDTIKHGIPQSLLIDGHNPLTLLHSALSEGLHAQTDAQCLELATSIRVVLTELVDRMSLALKEEEELSTAVSRLLLSNAEKATRGANGG